MKPFSLKPLLSSLLAGFIASLVHISLMEAKHRLGVLPAFEPQAYFQTIFSALIPRGGSAFIWQYLPDINGGLLLGFLFGRLFVYLPGSHFASKGMFFGLCAWLLLGVVVFPLGGMGVFAYGAGLGYLPAVLMLMMLVVYSVTMSLIYSRLV